MTRTFGAFFGATSFGCHHAVESAAFFSIVPPKVGFGAGMTSLSPTERVAFSDSSVMLLCESAYAPPLKARPPAKASTMDLFTRTSFLGFLASQKSLLYRHLDVAGADRRLECGVIELCLIGIRFREGARGFVELRTAAEVCSDRFGI